MVRSRRFIRSGRLTSRSPGSIPALVEAIEPRVLLSAADFDPSFGSGGVARVDLSGNRTRDGAKDLVVQPADGKLVVGGYTEPNSGDLDESFVVARFNSDGSPDASFGAAGVGRATFDAPALTGVELDAVALQPDGKIVAGGIEVEFQFGYEWNFALARFNADGTPDATFGDNGTVVLNFGAAGSYDRVTELAVRPDGRIVAVGVTQEGGFSHFALAQFNSNGTLDTTFGDGGKLRHVVGYSAWPRRRRCCPTANSPWPATRAPASPAYSPSRSASPGTPPTESRTPRSASAASRGRTPWWARRWITSARAAPTTWRSTRRTAACTSPPTCGRPARPAAMTRRPPPSTS